MSSKPSLTLEEETVACKGHEGADSPCNRKKLCHVHGTGEVILMAGYKAAPGREQCFDKVVQQIAHGFYHMQTGITDVRVCHPREGEASFCITFISTCDLEKFRNGPLKDAYERLHEVLDTPAPTFESSGCLMPDTHTMGSLIEFLKANVTGKTHRQHNVELVRKQIQMWYPRLDEFKRFIHWDQDSTKYTRNLVFSNENMEIILMCWPPRCKSSIHDHDESSCWAYCVGGQVNEIQYKMPCFDRTFFEKERYSPTGAVGRCGSLKVKTITSMSQGDCGYISNDIGLHCIENVTDKPAYTLHVYAPGLRKFKTFAESGDVAVHTLAEPTLTSVDGVRSGLWKPDTNPDGILDVHAWNKYQKGITEVGAVGSKS